MQKKNLLLIIFVFALLACQPQWRKQAPKYDYNGLTQREVKLHKQVEEFLFTTIKSESPIKVHPATRIDTLIIDDNAQKITVAFNKYLSYTPMREKNVLGMYRDLEQRFGKKYKNYQIDLKTIKHSIQELIPNYYRSSERSMDTKRMPLQNERPKQLVREVKTWQADKGLQGKNIVIWNSHGWYYDHKKERWEWQRPRLFQTVEDLLPTAFVLPYILPMLENAGATVFDPRERDIQTNMVVVDNDNPEQSNQNYSEIGDGWQTLPVAGFAEGLPPYKYENPFKLGTVRAVQTDSVATARVKWTPEIPEKGEYAVYVSYAASDSNTSDARYTVNHLGGATEFLVNQQISGNTWVYLGTFLFDVGLSPDSGSVILTNAGNDSGKWISADAVRFGGGTGIVERGGRASMRPRYVEGARYHLQYSGIPDTLVWSLNKNRNDYNDDYQSRGEYVNYLKGNPFGPNKNRSEKGLGVPVDLSVAFHTDAGITTNDTTIGTLAIYSLTGADTTEAFPDSVSRLGCRDFSDVVQTQIVEDIRAGFDPAWQRRHLMNAQYSESYRPNVPALLLELLSHQNFRDMQFAMDPQFRFTVSRAIYKGMLRYLANAHQQEYVVQPLPVTHFSATFNEQGNAILRWQAQEDPLEPTAKADKYIIYKRIEENGFDNGTVVDTDSLLIDDLKDGVIYSFKVVALNAGGKSFPSEVLAICKQNNDKKPVLVVNGFDRVSAPAIFKEGDISGFANDEDEGVPDRFDIGYTGKQNDFYTQSTFAINDAPGHGASYADYETKIIAGNTFDFTAIHGAAIREAGYSFVSCSDEVLMDGKLNANEYDVMDLILGEERTMPWLDSTRAIQFETFPQKLQHVLSSFTKAGGNLFASGSYIASDLFFIKDKNSPGARFGLDVLHIGLVSRHAAQNGRLFAPKDSLFNFKEMQYNNSFNDKIYKVEAPEALMPVGGRVILRYQENEYSAGVAYEGDYKTVVFGFPLETIIGKEQRTDCMKTILNFFEK